MTTSNPFVDPNIASQATELTPSYAISIVIVLAGLPLILVQPIAAGIVSIRPLAELKINPEQRKF
jgi:hypothetical protein